MKRPRPTIGTVPCQCGETGAVRRDRQNRLYYVCACGFHPMHGERGQEWMLEHAEIWGATGTPEDAPEWIKRGLGFPPGTRSTFSRPRAPARPVEPELQPEPAPGPAPEPIKEPIRDPAPAGIFGFR